MSRFAHIAARIDAVVIGASAGGVDALTLLLPALTPRTRVSCFIVLHLPRDRPSLLVDIFQPRCALPVFEAQDKDFVAPGTVYFAPPDYHLLLEKPERPGEPLQIALSVDEEVHYSRPSVDVLFESAAEVCGRRLMGIILTGANQDGTAGLMAVHAAGGIAVVQQPDEAHSTAMVTSALDKVEADFVLTLAEIAELLGTLGKAA